MKILLVEDESSLANIIKVGLKSEGYVVDICGDGQRAKQIGSSSHSKYDLIVLDIMLPGSDGFEVCSHIRKQGVSIPVIILTARSSVEDKVSMLNSGADDYLTKPFSFDELLARIRALLRRPAKQMNSLLHVHDITLDTLRHKVFKKGKIVSMTKKEFMMLEYLMRNPGQVIKRDDFYTALWDMNDIVFSNSVDVHIKNIRSKLDYKNESFIETVHGVGYVLKP